VPKAGHFLSVEINAYISITNQSVTKHTIATTAENVIGVMKNLTTTLPTGEAGGKPTGNPAPDTGSQKPDSLTKLNQT